MRDSVVAWIFDFLASREQSVKYRGYESHWLENRSGAPHGTRLGSTIFLDVINNACTELVIQCWKYVDDVTLHLRAAHGLNLRNKCKHTEMKCKTERHKINPMPHLI